MIKDILRELRIEKDYEENENGTYTIEVDDADEYARYYSRLEKSEMFEEDGEASQITDEISSIQFVDEDEATIITLMGNLDNDEYKMIVRIIE